MSPSKHFRWSQIILLCFLAVLARGQARTPADPALTVTTQSSEMARTSERSLSPEDVESVLSFPPPASLSVSPDGQFVAYALNDPRRRGEFMDQSLFTTTGVSLFGTGCDVWLTNTTNGRSENITNGAGSSWLPVWSPDGNYLAFYSDRGGQAQLWVREKSGKIRQVSDAIVRAISSWHRPVWTNDSKYMIARVLPPGVSLEEANALIGAPSKENKTDILVYTSPTTTIPQAWQTSGHLSDLAMIDVSNGTIRRLARGIKTSWQSVSPDGNELAFTTITRFQSAKSQQLLYDLVVVNLLDYKSRTIASDLKLSEPGRAISWSPDSKQLSYVEGGPQAKPECYLISSTGGVPWKATKESTLEMDRSEFPPPAPVWDLDGQHLYVIGSTKQLWEIELRSGAARKVVSIADRTIVEIVRNDSSASTTSVCKSGQCLTLLTRDTRSKQMGLYLVELKEGRTNKLFEDNKEYSAVLTNGHHIFFIAEDAQHPPDIWLLDLDSFRSNQLTTINPQVNSVTMGRSKLLEWIDTDGNKLNGALLLPSNYHEDRHYPLIVYVYGGSRGSNSINHFGLRQLGENLQLFATRGYAVLYPDIPLKVGTPMQDIAKAVLPGVNRAIELGIVDPNRVGVMGHSYGGYSTLSLIVQSTRFKAAVCSAGPANLFSLYGEFGEDGMTPGVGWAEETQGRLAGSPWEFRERYIENSPYFYLERVTTPVLIIQGTKDRNVYAFNSDELFVALRRLGKEAVYLKYIGEDHGVWSPKNQVDRSNRIIQWFDDHLKSQAKQTSAHTQ
jgi:dipeptidyl aminopeptidase/acylaminoacyl peptidase